MNSGCRKKLFALHALKLAEKNGRLPAFEKGYVFLFLFFMNCFPRKRSSFGGHLKVETKHNLAHPILK